jgi:orotate phosphoribosyltransferase
MLLEAKRGPQHPEGLTEAQERLADLLITARTEAKVRRRRQLPNGEFEFFEVVRPTSPIDFAQEGEFALKLHEKQPGAPLSPIYINLRNPPEGVLEPVGRVLAEIPSGERPDFCAGIPKAGIPIANAYSQFAGLPVLSNIFEKEQTATGRRIVVGEEADTGKGKTLRLVDDLVTQADTKLEAIRAAENLGYRVTDVAVLVDREQGGAEQLAEAGYQLHSAFKLSQLMVYYLRTGRINQARYDEVMAYLAAAR